MDFSIRQSHWQVRVQGKVTGLEGFTEGVKLVVFVGSTALHRHVIVVGIPWIRKGIELHRKAVRDTRSELVCRSWKCKASSIAHGSASTSQCRCATERRRFAGRRVLDQKCNSIGGGDFCFFWGCFFLLVEEGESSSTTGSH